MTEADDRNTRTISQLTFTDGSRLDIMLTRSEDHLAFVADGDWDPRNCAILHPEGVAARVFDLVDEVQTRLRPELNRSLFALPSAENVLWQALKIVEKEAAGELGVSPPPRGDDPMPFHVAVNAGTGLLAALGEIARGADLDRARLALAAFALLLEAAGTLRPLP